MGKAAYVGVQNIARKVKNIYIGVDGIARKVKKGYVGVDGVARLFYSAGARFVSYSGAYTTSDVTVDGVACTLYTLTSSGMLVVDGDGAQVWMCGGGGKGGNANLTWSGLAGASYNNIHTAYSGGGGAGGYIYSGEIPSGTHTVTIGAASGATIITTASGETFTAGQGGNNATAGGTAGGRYRRYDTYGTITTPGSGGAGVSTYPFGLSELYAHAAGGGSGSVLVNNYPAKELCGGGYAGGTNGGNSGAQASNYGTKASGGVRGGGAGGLVQIGGTGINGSKATFYGSGGGGGALYDTAYDYEDTYDKTSYHGSGAAGYQGVAYVLIPA